MSKLAIALVCCFSSVAIAKTAAKAAVPTLSSFEKLSKPARMKALYPSYKAGQDFWSLRTAKGFAQKPIRMTKTFSGSLLKTALTIYGRNRISQDGTAVHPIVKAFTRGKTTYAYTFKMKGEIDHDWTRTEVYDRNLRSIGKFGASE